MSFFKVYLFRERPREHAHILVQAGKGERERESVVSAQRAEAQLDLMIGEIMTRREIQSYSLNSLSHPGTQGYFKW